MVVFYTLDDNDYNPGPFMVNFDAGQTSTSFNVTIIDNNQLESSEIFSLTINSFSLPHNIHISNPDQVIVTILDDDCK